MDQNRSEISSSALTGKNNQLSHLTSFKMVLYKGDTKVFVLLQFCMIEDVVLPKVAICNYNQSH